ncbi:hypothetical protein GCK32_004049 [Trichostrongylus colubriformis]|uniref:Uncharacterized protein n=1 Tax=Trichostrongylus colubriformis TaxID=6319 RepID=A0AAN8IJC8_TRICO
MDANTKVTKYLADLSHDGARRKDNSTHVNTTALQTIRGPGQAAHDPLQFVSTSAVAMAESARQLISITEQQKRERAKLTQHGGPLKYDESWQEDLDTWRRKRKTKVAKQDSVESTGTASVKDYRPASKEYHSLPGYGRMHKDTKEEILTIHSPSSHQEDLNDSGIENRTTDSHSPSTSLDFSPRSDSKHISSDSISPKHTTYTAEKSVVHRAEQPPDYAPPPPPPPQAPSDTLDQVVIPLSVTRSTTGTSLKPTEDEDYPPPPPHLRRRTFSGDRGEYSSRFESVSADIKSPEYRFEERTTTKPYVEFKDTHNVDLTIELNREQRGQVTAIRYPATKKIETVPSPDESRGATFISQISHQVQPPPSTASVSAATSRTTISAQSSASPGSQHKGMPPTTVYRTVDIPFDESPAAYQPKKDENIRTITVTMGTHPVQKGLGFSIGIERGRPTIDSVIVSSPADRAGLLIGDRVISINGEDLKDKYPSAINRMLHEAARLGEAEVCIERKDAKIAQVKSITSVENFDKVRSVFTEKTIDSYAEFKRKHSRASRADQPSPREYNSLPRSTSSGVLSPGRRDSSISANQRSAAGSPSRSYFESRTSTRSEFRTSNGPSSDYKVTSMHEKTGPGKLTDFVPESERAAAKAKEEEKKEFSYRRVSDDEPRLIRNYDLPPATPTTTRVTPTPIVPSPYTASRRITTTSEPVSAVPKRSTLPRDTHVHEESRHVEDDTVAGRSYLRKTLRQSLSPPPVGILRRSPDIDYSPAYKSTFTESRRAAAAEATRDYRSDHWTCTYPTSHRRSRSSYELRDRGGRDYSYEDRYLDRDAYVREKLELDEMYRKRTQERSARRDYVPRTTVVPIYRMDGDYRRTYPTPSRPYHIGRSKSSDYILEKEYIRADDIDISDASHRFYDRAGNYVNRDVRRGYDVDIRRDYDFARDADRRSWRDSWRQPRLSRSVERETDERLEYEEKEKRMWIPERRVVESRDWRDVIDQQRQPAPGYAADTRRIRDASASLGNLPAIINRKLEETRKLEKERQTSEYGYRSFDGRREPLVGESSRTEAYDRSADYNRFEKSYAPDYRTRHYDSSSPSPGYGRRERSAAFREEVRREPISNEQVVAVSGKHRCAHCADELGRGAAMIIESLNLFYHLSCFKCYVCKTPLGSGATGADVRVREGRLHCQSCYSNDRLQLSKV